MIALGVAVQFEFRVALPRNTQTAIRYCFPMSNPGCNELQFAAEITSCEEDSSAEEVDASDSHVTTGKRQGHFGIIKMKLLFRCCLVS